MEDLYTAIRVIRMEIPCGEVSGMVKYGGMA